MTYYARLLITLMGLPKIGSTTARKILDGLSFKLESPNDFNDVLDDSREKMKIPDFTMSDVEHAISRANQIEETSDRAGIKITSIFDNNYPNKLKRLKKPPVILNHIGDISMLTERRNCAVIGTRNPTQHGYEYGIRMSKKMAERDFVVVSGLAIGCDTAGHKGCLEVKGKTVAVLAQGLNVDKVYPKQNRGLAKEIINTGGVLISEYTIDQLANQNFFVERDRIQAGLSDFLFVIETGLTGGTWHTINFALESKIPVATYNHPDKYKHLEQTLGNQKLISDRDATGIYSLDDLDNFLSTVYKDHLDSINDLPVNNNSVLGPIAITQPTIDHSIQPGTEEREPKTENLRREEPKKVEAKPKNKKTSTKKKGSDPSQLSIC